MTDNGRPIHLSSLNTDKIIAFNTVGGYKGYAGVFNGDEDMYFGTGFLNTTGKVHLVTGSFPRLTGEMEFWLNRKHKIFKFKVHVKHITVDVFKILLE